MNLGHLNALITKNNKPVSYWICEMKDGLLIEQYEKLLIQKYNPRWNLQK